MQEQLELLGTLIVEGTHAAAEFNVARLEELVGQQEALLRGLPRPLPSEEGSGQQEALRQLRRTRGVFSRVLVSTSRTLAALNAARQSAGAAGAAAVAEVN